MDADALESALIAKAKAPGVVRKRMDDLIAASTAAYHVFPDTTVTVCCLTLPNGHHLIGHSACVARQNFDAETGRRLAHERAAGRLWELEGYALRCEIADMMKGKTHG